MNTLVRRSHVEAFRGIVAGRLGLSFGTERSTFLAEVLGRRLVAVGGDCDAYLSRLAVGRMPEELGPLSSELTNNETYFFRNIEQFHALAETVLPELIRTREPGRPLRLLSAGCSSGEEAYTISMMIHDSLPDQPVSILAIDVDPAMLRKAENGRYSKWSLRSTPDAMRSRWFRADGNDVLLDPRIRRSVRFGRRNLMDANADLWQPATFDVIFCRNVLMYFTPETAKAVLARLTPSLVPGGYLFLGHTETLRGVSDRFQFLHSHNTFYYRRAEPSATSRQDPGAGVHPQAAVPPQAGTASVILPAWDRALELLGGERYTEALHLVEGFPTDLGSRTDSMVLHAALLTHCDQLERAEELCRRLLGVEGATAAAHYLLGSCRDQVGDAGGAVDHYHAATAFDPGFAMPRVRLGQLARRRGDDQTARRELWRALALLVREDSMRLLLFSGGFTREALIAMCQRELVASGGTP